MELMKSSAGSVGSGVPGGSRGDNEVISRVIWISFIVQ